MSKKLIIVKCDKCDRILQSGQGGFYRLLCYSAVTINDDNTKLEPVTIDKKSEIDVNLCSWCIENIRQKLKKQEVVA